MQTGGARRATASAGGAVDLTSEQAGAWSEPLHGALDTIEP